MKEVIDMALPKEKQSEITINRKNKGLGNNRGSGYVSTGTAHLSFLTGDWFVFIGSISFVAMLILLSLNTILFVICGLIFLASAYVLIAGKIEVKEREVAIVQRWGAYMGTLKPGLHFIIPGVDAVVYKEEEKRTMFTEQKAIKLPLFKDEDGKSLKIEFQLSTEDGVDFGVYYKIIAPERAIYFADNLERYIADKVENCAKAAFGSTLVEDAIQNKLEVVENTHVFLAKSSYMKKSANELLADAGIEIESVYFNDIDLSEATKAKRKDIFDKQQTVRIQEQEIKVQEKTAEVEEAKVKVEAKKALQEGKKGDATRNRIDGIRGKDKDLTAQEAINYEIQMEKYRKGVQITEINVGGGSGASEVDKTVAKAAAIINSMSGKDKKSGKGSEGGSEEESEDRQDGEGQREEKKKSGQRSQKRSGGKKISKGFEGKTEGSED